MWLRKRTAGNAPGLSWENDGDVLEVPDGLGAELLALPAGDFEEADPPKGGKGQARKTPVAE